MSRAAPNTLSRCWTRCNMTIADLIPVIVGAAAGVAGGIGASIHAQYRQSKREIHKELRSNLLAVALEASKIYALIREKESYIIASSAEGLFESGPESMRTQAEPYPVQKIQAIVSLYFPAILDHARELTFAWFHHPKLLELNCRRYLIRRMTGKLRRKMWTRKSIICGVSFRKFLKNKCNLKKLTTRGDVKTPQRKIRKQNH